MPRQTEPNANNALGDMLRGMTPDCEVRSENTQTFIDHPGRHADVLIVAPGRSPVVIEAEYEPAVEVEKDAYERLGLRVRGTPRTVEAAIALRYPKTVEDAYDLRLALVEIRLTYCVLHQDGSRFPESGWLDGSVSDLADIARLVSVPQKAVEQAADTLEQGIGQAATRLEEMANLRPNLTPVIARLLGMSDVPQTRRMACAIIANAMIFHQRIAGMHQGVKPLRLVCGPNVADPQSEVLAAWEDILKTNYWPIFAIAKDILEQLPGGAAASILRELLESASEKTAVLARVASSTLPKRQVLKDLGVPKSTYYRWLTREQRCQGLENQPGGGLAPWNRLSQPEEQAVLTVARRAPELSCRQLAAWITDN